MLSETTFEEVEFKDYKKADRNHKSISARRRRKLTKQIRETRLLNEYARQRRNRKRRQ